MSYISDPFEQLRAALPPLDRVPTEDEIIDPHPQEDDEADDEHPEADMAVLAQWVRQNTKGEWIFPEWAAPAYTVTAVAAHATLLRGVSELIALAPTD